MKSHAQLVEERAIALSNDPVLLLKELKSAKACLAREYIPFFKQATFDFERKRLNGTSGYFLQWQLREHPHLPQSYENQQTNRGQVILLRKTLVPANKAIDIDRLLKGYTDVYDSFYTYGDESLYREHVIEALEIYHDFVLSVAFTTSHPAYKSWVDVFNLLSTTEAQEWERRHPIPLAVLVCEE